MLWLSTEAIIRSPAPKLPYPAIQLVWNNCGAKQFTRSLRQIRVSYGYNSQKRLLLQLIMYYSYGLITTERMFKLEAEAEEVNIP